MFWRVPIAMMLFGSCSGHPPAARSPAALPPLPSGIWAVAHRVQQLKPFDWSRRRQLNAFDGLGIDVPTFMLGDWRATSGSMCSHECNDPVTGLGTTGQCDEDTSVCSIGTDCEDCGKYDLDEALATWAEDHGCHAEISMTCSGSVGTWTAGCAAVGIEDRTMGGDDNLEYIDPGQASSSCSAGGSSASFTAKYASRDDTTPINMKDIQCHYYDRSSGRSNNMQKTVATFRRTLSTPLSSITCPSDAPSARVLAVQRPVGTEYYEMSVFSQDVTCTGDCGALVCSSTCAPPTPPASGIELCPYTTSDCSDTPQQSECSTFTDENIKETCVSGKSVLGGDSVTGAANVACEDDTLKLELYSNSQCNSDVSSECHIFQAFTESGMTDCHIAFELNKCINFMGLGMHARSLARPERAIF
jgi:hypothetical protein